MNTDVIDNILKWVTHEMSLCENGILRHDGGKEDALKTYRAVIEKLESTK